MTEKLTPNEIIDALGGTSKVARLCEVQPPSVSEWRRNGIPKAQLRFLRLARPEIFERPQAELTGNDSLQRQPERGGRQPSSPKNMLDTVPDGAVIVPTPSL